MHNAAAADEHPVTHRLERGLLALLACLGSFVPHGVGPALPLETAIGASELPWLLRSVLCAVLLLLAMWAWPRFPWPLALGALLAWVLISSWAAVIAASYAAPIAWRGYRQRGAYSSVALGAVALPGVVAVGLDRHSLILTLLNGALLVGLPSMVGLWVQTRRSIRRERAEHAKRQQEARAEQARVAERARIARDMHDVVAHRVSLMVLYAEAIGSCTTDEQAADHAGLIRTNGREALEQVRDVLGVLSTRDSEAVPPQQQHTLAALEDLVRRSRSAGLPVTFSRDTPERELPAAVEQATYRLVQEGLTNVHKHAGLVATEVWVRQQPAAIEVAVRNADPPRPVDPMPGSGMGLSHVRERIAQLDGQVEAFAQSEGGFLVRANIPVADEEGAT